MKIFEASSRKVAFKHPVAAFRFFTGKKNALHRAIILDSAAYLFGDRFIKSKWESALDEIEKYELVPPVVNAEFVNAGNNLNTTFGKWIYCCTRVFAPLTMIETGVAHGASSWIILNAMEKNGKGTLYSIDLPDQDTNEAYNFKASAKTGWMVPDALKQRWKLHLGDARIILPQLLNSLGAIDCFFHDSDHSYAHMQFEFDTVHAFLTEGGILLSDDVHKNAAFAEHVEKHNLRALQFNKGGCAIPAQ